MTPADDQFAECPTRLITDTPSDADAFGGHSRVASALRQLLQNESGAKAVALEGRWGSGKSTILNLLRDQLSEDEWTFIQFDAWAHEGDPLRRVFLDKTTEVLKSKQWVESQVWDSRLERLRRRISEQDTRTSPRLTRLGHLVIASLLVLVPTGLALFSSGLDSRLYLGGDPIWRAWFGVGLIATPVLLVLLARLSPFRLLLVGEQADGQNIDQSGLLAQLWFRRVTHEHSETVEDPEPTSIEFAEYFGDLMEEALSSKDRRIVIALDNLDRVTPHLGVAVVTTLQTFLQQPDHDQPGWRDRAWFIVPYDREGMVSLWQHSGHSYHEDVGGSFLDKMFSVRFTTPPIVLSDWRDYLRQMLRAAFPEHDASELDLAGELIGMYVRTPPTPRDLKKAVNQVGSLHRQWEDAFPLHHLALYTILEQRHSGGHNVARQLLEADLLGPEIWPLVGTREALYDSLAALSFNVEVPVARQLLLTEPIVNALKAGSSEQLLGYTRHTGFWDVLIGSSLRQSSIPIASAALALEPVLKDAQPYQRAHVVAHLEAEMGREDLVWVVNDPLLFPGLAAFLRIRPTDAALSRVMQAISIRIQSSEGGERGSLPATELPAWTSGAVVLLDEIERLDLHQDRRSVSVPSEDPEGFIEVMAQLHAVGATRHAGAFRLPPDTQSITSQLVDGVGGDGPAASYADAIEVMVNAGFDLEWSEVTSALLDWLSKVEEKDASAVEKALRLLNESLSLAGGIDAITQLAQTGHLLHYIQALRSSPSTVGLLALLHLKELPGLPSPPNLGQSPAGFSLLNSIVQEPDKHEEAVSAIADHVRRTGEVVPLLQLPETNETLGSLSCAVLKAVDSERSLGQFLKPDELPTHWADLLSCFADERFDDLVAEIFPGAEGTLIEGGFQVSEARLYLAAVRGDAVSDDLRSWLSDELARLETGTWSKALREGSPLARLTVEILEQTGLDLGTQFRDALAEFAKSLIKGEPVEPWMVDRGVVLAQALDASQQKSLRDDLYASAKRAGGNIAGSFFDVFGDVLSDPDKLKTDPTVVAELFVPLVRADNRRGIRWMAGFIQEHSGILEDYGSPHSVKDLEQRLDELLDKGEIEEEFRADLDNLRRGLGPPS